MNNQHTINISFRCDIRQIATIAQFWHCKGEHIRYMSDVLSLTTSAAFESVIQDFPQFEVNSTTKAVEILEKLKIFNIKKPNRNKKFLLKAMSKEALQRSQMESSLKVENSLENPFGSAKEQLNEELMRRLSGEK